MLIDNNILDERSGQDNFYKYLFGDNWNETVHYGMSTDGYTDYILFEHKKNVQGNGIGKTLAQALIYLTKFNREGIPVPGTIMLVSQEEKKVYIYSSNNYSYIINDIATYGQINGSRSFDITKLLTTEPIKIIEYDFNYSGFEKLRTEIGEHNNYFKVNPNKYNLVGLANYFYSTAYVKDRTKKKFFENLKVPTGFMSKIINPWNGNMEEFSAILDLVNDPKTQKKLGAFYTPKQYCEKAVEMLRELIENFKKKHPGKDYLIIDRCGGSGNIESLLTDEELSHCIINTYELKEWIALKNRIGRQVRMLIPEINEDGSDPINDNGLLRGSDAFSEEFCNTLKKAIKECRLTEECGIFFIENPPYGEKQSIANQKFFNEEDETNDEVDVNEEVIAQMTEAQEEEHVVDFKKSYLCNIMRNSKDGSGAVTNDMANLFIWSAFNIFMENEDDGYVVFGPIKYWKNQGLVSPTFVNGIISNAEHYHASSFAISIISWINKHSDIDKFKLKAYDIVDDKLVYKDTVTIKKTYYSFADKYFEHREIENGIDSIVIDNDGTEYTKDKSRVSHPKRTDDILGYQVACNMQLNQPQLGSNLLVQAAYGGCGEYIYKDNFIYKMPMFAAGFYGAIANKWWYKSLLNKTGDGYEKYNAAIKDGSIDDWLIKCLIWSCLTNHNHMRCITGSDGHTYINQFALCQDSFIDEFIKNSEYKFTEREKDLIVHWNNILSQVKTKEEYNPNYKYGLHQIEKEINIRIGTGTYNRDGKEKTICKYGDLDNIIKSFKKKLDSYYIDELTDNLFKYEFIK